MSRTLYSLQKNHFVDCRPVALILALHLVVFGQQGAWGEAGHANISWDSGAGVGNWSDPINWSLNQVPIAIDAVSIGQLPIAENNWVNLDTIQAIEDLEIWNGMTLDTNGFPLAVGDAIEIDGRNVTPGGVIFPSRLIVDNGFFLDDLVTDRIFVSDGARLELRNGARVRINTQLYLWSNPGEPRPAISGTGVIDFYGDTLDPDGPFPARAASFSGNLWVDALTLNQNGTARIDLDGIDDTGSINLSAVGAIPEEMLTVNGDALYDAFDGEIFIADDNRLNMNLAEGWTLGENGLVTLIGIDGTLAVIEGSDLDFRGTLRNFDGQIDADVAFQNTAQIEFRGDSILRLEGATTFAGANFYEFDGSSVPHIRQNGNLTVTENTTLAIPSGVFDWDGQSGNTVTTVEAGVDFAIQASAIEAGLGATYDGTTWLGVGSELTVETPGSWSNDGLIVLDNARIEGARIVNLSSMVGSGLISPTGIDNRGSIQASGGQLSIGLGQGEAGIGVPIAPIDGIDVIDPGVVNYGFDLDGANEDGVLIAVNGDMRINGFQGFFVFNGTLTVGFGNQFLMNTGGLHNAGTMTLAGGGRYNGDLRQAGLLIVSPGGVAGIGDATIISDDTRFSSPGTNQLDADLLLEGNFFVESSATFFGNGTLVNLEGSTLALEMHAVLGVAVENNGLLELGNAGGTAEVLDFVNTVTGTLAIDLSSDGGLPGFDQDRLVVDGLAELLGGTLLVDLLGGFMPTAGDVFTVLTAADGVLGTFDAYDLPALTGGNQWLVNYEPNRVALMVSPVPEPSTLLLAVFAAVGLLPRGRSASTRNHR